MQVELSKIMEIYHNPRCRKSQESLKIIRSKGVEPTIVLYLDNPPSFKELQKILYKLKLPAHELVRKSEDLYKKEYKGKHLTEEQWIAAMVDHPRLIERPIIIEGNRAIIGRPPERVLDIL